MKRILIAEDQSDIRNLLVLNLRNADYEVTDVADGLAALASETEKNNDLLILDLMMPGLDGLEVCKTLRARGCNTPILMLTAKSTELDRVLGLELGADDYLTKPLHNGALELLPSRRQAQMNGKDLDFTALEFDLLLHFMQHPGQVFSRSQLLNAVWGYTHDGYEHTVTTHINRLRAKLESDPLRPEMILTVRGAGYKMRDAPL